MPILFSIGLKTSAKDLDELKKKLEPSGDLEIYKKGSTGKPAKKLVVVSSSSSSEGNLQYGVINLRLHLGNGRGYDYKVAVEIRNNELKLDTLVKASDEIGRDVLKYLAARVADKIEVDNMIKEYTVRRESARKAEPSAVVDFFSAEIEKLEGVLLYLNVQKWVAQS